MSQNFARSSLKKLGSFHKKQDIEIIELDKVVRSQQKMKSLRKQKSTERAQSIKNLINANFQENIGKELKKQKMHTQIMQQINYSSRQLNKQYKNPYLKLLAFKKNQRNHIEKSNAILDMSKKFEDFQVVHIKQNMRCNNLKNIFFNNSIKKSNVDRNQLYITGKNSQSKRQSQQRSTSNSKKKIKLNRHPSENLKKLKIQSIIKQADYKNKFDKTIHKKAQIKKIEQILKSPEQQQIKLRTKSKLNDDKSKRINTEPNDFDAEYVFIKPKKKNQFQLSRQQMETFGNRFPEAFEKVKLLGRGGFSLVWLGEHKKTKKKFAVKQIRNENNNQTHMKQIWFGSYFFQLGGIPKKQFESEPGIKNLVKLYSYEITKQDTWVFYQKCGESLGSALYDLKGESHGNERYYRIVQKSFYVQLKNNQNQIRKILIQVAKALDLLSKNNIVHSDLKTQNILIKLKKEEETSKTLISEIKLIDYGSSFSFSDLIQFSMATPQYMAPQILNYLLHENNLEYIPKFLQYIKNYNNNWVIDIWSLGCVLLQIVSGIPLWMSLKTIVQQNNKEVIRYGLFAIKGRIFGKIIQRQIDVVQHLDNYLREENYSKIVLEKDLKIALKRMLSLDPTKRIKPCQLIELLVKNMS